MGLKRPITFEKYFYGVIMGYHIDYKGEMKFTNEVTGKELAKLNTILGEDVREHPEWDAPEKYMSYISLEINDDFSGIKWDGSEKSGEMAASINLAVNEMKKEFPDFELTGKMEGQGEEVGDHFFIVFKNGVAVEEKISLSGGTVTCPSCNHAFKV